MAFQRSEAVPGQDTVIFWVLTKVLFVNIFDDLKNAFTLCKFNKLSSLGYLFFAICLLHAPKILPKSNSGPLLLSIYCVL